MIIPPAGADIMRERQKEAALYPHLEDSLTGQHQFQKSVWRKKNQEDIQKYLKNMENISNKKESDYIICYVISITYYISHKLCGMIYIRYIMSIT